MQFSENLKKARKKAGLSQIQLAEKIGVTQTAIHQYESGKREPNLQTKLKIAELIDMDTDEIYESVGIVPANRVLEDERESNIIFNEMSPFLKKFGYMIEHRTGNSEKGNPVYINIDGVEKTVPSADMVDVYEKTEEIISSIRGALYVHFLDEKIKGEK